MSLEKKWQFLSIGTTTRMKFNYYYYVSSQKSKIIMYYAVSRGKVKCNIWELTYSYSFLTKIKGLCVILITIINIIKLTFNSIRWSSWSPFQITMWMRPWNASCFSIFCTYRDENKEPASLDLECKRHRDKQSNMKQNNKYF